MHGNNWTEPKLRPGPELRGVGTNYSVFYAYSRVFFTSRENLKKSELKGFYPPAPLEIRDQVKSYQERGA